MSEKLIELISDESFQRWIGGRATQSELEMWNKWLQQSSYNKTLHNEASNILEAARFKTSRHPDINGEWKRLNTRLNLTEANQNYFIPERKFNYKLPNINIVSSRFLGIAAVAAIIIVIFIHFFQMILQWECQ